MIPIILVEYRHKGADYPYDQIGKKRFTKAVCSSGYLGLFDQAEDETPSLFLEIKYQTVEYLDAETSIRVISPYYEHSWMTYKGHPGF